MRMRRISTGSLLGSLNHFEKVVEAHHEGVPCLRHVCNAVHHLLTLLLESPYAKMQ